VIKKKMNTKLLPTTNTSYYYIKKLNPILSKHFFRIQHRSFVLIGNTTTTPDNNNNPTTNNNKRPNKIQIVLAAESVERVVHETNAFVQVGRQKAYDALALEDALKVEITEHGSISWIRMMRKETSILMNKGGPPLPQGLVLVGARDGGIQEAISRGLEKADSSVVARLPFSLFMNNARKRMLQHLSNPDIVFRDPIPYFIEDIKRTNVQILVLENVLVDSLFDAMLLRRMFFGLFGYGLGIIMSSSRPPRQWYSNGIHREKFMPFIDLIEHRCEITRLDGSGLGEVIR
jgi:predicted ATPase